MLTVETIGRIRRAHFIKGKTIKEIARDLKVSRNTVRRVLRSGATSFEYERDVQPRPKLGRWTEELDALLSGNAAKPAREQLTLIRIFEELRGRGYDGGYDAVRRYARRWSKQHGEATAAAYVPLSFAPGEAYQFDWSHEVVLLSGVTVIVKVAHVRLCHSRMLFVRAYPRETQEMVFDAHDRAFALFKGTCGRGILAIGRWSTSSPRCSPTGCRRSRPHVPKRSPTASTLPMSSSTSLRVSVILTRQPRSSRRQR
jgi:transposase